MSKKLTKKSLLFSTLVLSMVAASQVQADENTDWTARSAEEIRANLVTEGNKTTYTVQYGDTLSAIAEAVGVDINILANINKISDVNLIYPGTVLTITYNEQKEVATVKIESPAAATEGQAVTATADLTTNQVLVEDKLVKVEDLTVESPVVTSESIVEQVTQSVVSAAPTTPAYGETDQPVKEAINQVVEATSTPEVKPVASVEELTQSIVSSTETPSYGQSTETVTEAINRVVEAKQETVSETPAVSEVAQEAVSETPASSEVAQEAVSETPASSEVAQETVSETPASSEVAQEAVSETPASSEVAQETISETPASSEVAQEAISETPASSEVAQEAVSETPATSEVAQETVSETPAPTQTLTYDSTGMQPKAAAFQSEVGNTFGISNIGGYRPGDPQDHGKGLAVDVMVDSVAQGNQVAQYAIDNMANNDISYVIWQQQFYAPVNNIYGPANTWNPMPDRGSATQNHMDHVHVSFNE
ncbi:LysM peptidoglycan-binding domain-containing protein [Streptococcus cuniculipharyngis]|uniref:LysM peptidoglycan-binding domain-containing protein n=1 Tax=Streptococcus cuniculipharyngis TaxID=1562651 RepID=A0A5C5SAK3_9STRE|nr:LysM domain-containing protein [Streptococcus cuniculipharyngis]TWS96701.1 LysM peptidoglycan-binding domain-containing protein [Streptococcus cuniculipharyngis]